MVCTPCSWAYASAVLLRSLFPSGVPQDLVVGKVIMRVPWVGHLPLFMRNGFGIPLVIVIIVLIVVYEFVLPLFRKKPENDDAVDLGNVKKPV